MPCCGAPEDPPAPERAQTCFVAFLLQHLDRAIHNLLLIPMEAFKGCGDPALGIEDVGLDAVRFTSDSMKLTPSSKWLRRASMPSVALSMR